MISGFEKLRSIFPSFPSLPHLSVTSTHKMAPLPPPEDQPVNEYLFLADVTSLDVHFSSDLEAEVEDMPAVEAELEDTLAELEEERNPDHPLNVLHGNMQQILDTQGEIDEVVNAVKREAREEYEAQHGES
jgi:hypothetical protein